MVSTDRSLRSVFVGNIPYDATEEKLKDIFNEVGPVQSFRLVYDRETGKPKGYGFCEYKDAETAHSAIRNLNNYELGGRNLRVDSAANERNREEMRNLPPAAAVPPPQQFVESPYGAADVDPEKAPEAISKAVASLPPEQMFELARQMRNCIQSNPHEARNMLMQNPQLAYALLQALVVMRAVKPDVAASILHRPAPSVAPLAPLDQAYAASGYQQAPPAMAADFRRQAVPTPAPADPRRADPRVVAADPRVRNQMAAAAAAAPAMSADKAVLLQQVMSLSDAQLQLLPQNEQETIRQLRRDLATQQGIIR